MKRAITLLQSLAAESDQQRGIPIGVTDEPDETISSLLQDLDDGTRNGNVPVTSGTRQVDTQQIAALSITFEITET